MVTYFEYKRFDNEKLIESHITYFNKAKHVSYDAFENSVLHTLERMAPIKQKYIRVNQSPFIYEIKKQIPKRIPPDE